MAESLKEFEDQLQQEALANEQQLTDDGSNVRKDVDGTVYEYDSVRKAWIPKVIQFL